MDNSEFGDNIDFFALTDIVPLNNNGSTSDTYRVRISGKWHFLKRPKQAFTNHPQYNAAFEKEFDIGYTLDHPNIVRYISKGKDKNGFYFLTEYVDGQTLKDFISNNPTYFKKKEHIQKFIEQLLSAISYLHQKQILHLDLKPENILITNIGYDVKIIDLGFAYSDCYQFLTIGKTNLYAAPEQINNSKIDQRTDIYGIGMVLLYVFTQTADKKLLNKIPQPYKSIVSKCLTDNIEDRYFDISVLNRDIAQSSKNKPAKYFLLILVLLVVGLFFFIKPHLTKENEIPNETRVVLTDTIKVEKDSIIQNKPMASESKIKQDSQSFKNENIDISNLTPRIEKEIKGNFDKLYSKYSEADLMNQFNDVQQTYQNAVSASFEIANTLYSENPQIPINEVNALIRKELDKNTATYLNWLMQFDKKQIAKSNKGGNAISVNSIIKAIRYPIDEINSLSDKSTLAELNWLMEYEKKQKTKIENEVRTDSLMKAVQLLVQQEYNKIFSMNLSPIDILDIDRYNAINSMCKTTVHNYGFLLSTSLSSTYPHLPLNELEPIKNWITAETNRNKLLYDNWMKDYCQKHKDEINAFAKENGIYINTIAKGLMGGIKVN